MKMYCFLLAVSYLLLETFAAGSGNVSEGDPNTMATVPVVAAAAAKQSLANCSEDESFTLTGLHDFSYDGCYSALTVSDITWYSLDGKVADGLFFYPNALYSTGDIWFFGTATVNTAEDTITRDSGACYDSSLRDASTVHPIDIDLWICDSSPFVDSDGFNTTCGCSNSDNSASPSLGVGLLSTGGAAFLVLLGGNFL